MISHPRKNHHQQVVMIKAPHSSTRLETWADPHQMALVVPHGSMPEHVNSVPIAPWREVPSDRAEWIRLAASSAFTEPPFDAMGKEPAAGCVVVEPDGRVWLVAPTNAFDHTPTTFPKGKAHGMDLRATAIKEVFEESGLQVELFAHLVDVTRSTSRTRYYLARRVGGNPAAMGWESQAVLLAPVEDLKGILNKPVDHTVVEALLEEWGTWASWFHSLRAKEPDFESARDGQIPARREHWCTLPLPKGHITLPLDLRLTQEEAAGLKLGFIPRDMDQKWFAYFEAGVLFEHRSWTGFCITHVHFVPEGEGLRATHAEVNRTSGQYSAMDDEEDCRQICERVLGLARLGPRERCNPWT